MGEAIPAQTPRNPPLQPPQTAPDTNPQFQFTQPPLFGTTRETPFTVPLSLETDTMDYSVSRGQENDHKRKLADGEEGNEMDDEIEIKKKPTTLRIFQRRYSEPGQRNKMKNDKKPGP